MIWLKDDYIMKPFYGFLHLLIYLLHLSAYVCCGIDQSIYKGFAHPFCKIINKLLKLLHDVAIYLFVFNIFLIFLFYYSFFKQVGFRILFCCSIAYFVLNRVRLNDHFFCWIYSSVLLHVFFLLDFLFCSFG